MAEFLHAETFRSLLYGKKADKAAAALPQTATGTLFTVTGGRILLTSLVGQVTTIIQAQPNAVKIQSVPTTGTTKDLSGTLDINAFEVGALVSLDGTALTTALSGTNAGGALILQRPIVVPIGTISLNTAASSTGQMKWSMTYVAYDDGASAS